MRQSFPTLLSCALLLQVLPGPAQAAQPPLPDTSCATSGQIPSGQMPPAAPPPGSVDPLPSWKDGAARRSILAYVERVSRCGSPEWIPPEERIAVLDNDGTLWPENPIPIQLAYLLDTLRDRVRQTPSLANDPAVSAALRGDLASLLKGPDSEEAMGRHTDGQREYAYDAKPSSSGKLVEGLRQAPDRGWLVVDMARDWSVVFSPVSTGPTMPACRF